MGIQSDIANLKGDLGGLHADERTVRDAMSQAKGGWRVIVAVDAISGVLGALLSKFIPFLK